MLFRSELTIRARELGLTVGDGIDKVNHSYGKNWALEKKEDRRALAWLICKGLRPRGTHTGTPCTNMCLLGSGKDAAETPFLVNLSRMIAQHQNQSGWLASNENPVGSSLHQRPEWVKEFGTVDSPKWEWRYTRTTGCQFGLICPEIGRAHV